MATIKNQQIKVNHALQDNPSLRPQLSTIGARAYESVVLDAVPETVLDESTFPATFEKTDWSWEQVLDSELYSEYHK